MPAPRRCLRPADVVHHVAERVLRPRPDPAVGIELEWLTHDPRRPGRRPRLAEVEAVRAEAAEQLPYASRVTIEPGGQLEISTPPMVGVDAACAAAAGDLYALERVSTEHGLDLVALGADPLRPACRIVTEGRYGAMQDHFDGAGPDGLAMMCNTASLQLNVGLGTDAGGERWRLANALGPTLVAAFPNSPFATGGPSGWCSTRLRHWWAIDPTRTAPVGAEGHPVDTWARYALAANTMLVRSVDGRWVPVRTELPFARWLAEGHELGWPTEDDLAYHLTTLFPPVRPRGWLELRLLDALPTPYWQVATAVVVALHDDPEAAVAARRAVTGTEHRWVDAAHHGLADPALAAAADACFTAAVAGLGRLGVDDGLVAVVERYRERFVARGRCPADDLLDLWRRTGVLLPPPESPLHVRDLEAQWP